MVMRIPWKAVPHASDRRWTTTGLFVVSAALVTLALGGLPSAETPAERTVPDQTSKAAGGSRLLKNPVALQLYSLRESIKAEGVPATLAKVKAMGLTHVELAGTGDLTPEAFKAELDKAGLTPISMHVDIMALRKDPDAAIKNAKTFGVKYVGSAWFPHDGPFTAAHAEQAITIFNEVGAKLKAAGLTFFYHPHGYEFVPTTGGGTLFDTIVAKTNPDHVSFELDIFWAYHGGADPAALLRKYPKRFVLTHLKDMKKGTERNLTGSAPDDSSVALGTGEVDVSGVMEAAKDTAIEWHIIEEESSAPEKNIPAGMAYLQSLK
jgi:sugar phosphate isomerase/epimerase